MGMLDKVKGIVSKNSEKIHSGIEKAGDVIDKKTKGKYTDKLNKVDEAAKKLDKSAKNESADAEEGDAPAT